jgi:hypothetical protein
VFGQGKQYSVVVGEGGGGRDRHGFLDKIIKNVYADLSRGDFACYFCCF